MIRTKQGQELHDRFVLSKVGILSKRGYNKIYADLPGCEKPSKIGEYIPDIYAFMIDRKTGSVLRAMIVEVETMETMTGIHTRLQHSAFAAFAAKYTNVEFNKVLAE
jgi:hypothetical protein